MIIPLDAEILESLTKTEREVIQFINSNENRLSQLSIVDIAYETFSSPATVSRAIRKCKINGFNELRYKLASGNSDKQLADVSEILNKSLIEASRTVEQISMADVLKSIQLIRDARRIYVFARGMTEYIANEFCFKLQLMGLDAMMTDDPKIMVSICRAIAPENLVVIFSLNGHTPELVESAINAHGMGCPVITCSCNGDSELAPFSTVHIVGYKHSHISFRSYEVTSRLPLLIISRVLIDELISSSEDMSV